jgi:hypothetical protein
VDEPSTTLDSTPESTPVTRNRVCIKPGMLHRCEARFLRVGTVRPVGANSYPRRAFLSSLCIRGASGVSSRPLSRHGRSDAWRAPRGCRTARRVCLKGGGTVTVCNDQISDMDAVARAEESLAQARLFSSSKHSIDRDQPDASCGCWIRSRRRCWPSQSNCELPCRR